MRGLSIASFLFLAGLAPAEVKGLRVADGFEIRQFSGEDLATDITCMTVDTRGRVTVAGPGYVRILVDSDDDGEADKVIPFAAFPKDGAQGLLWVKDKLYVVGDGGIYELVDANDDGKLDGPPRGLIPITTGGEHTAHALKLGPDGKVYWMVGDGAGVTDRVAVASPALAPRKPIGGCLIRMDAGSQQPGEIVAHGFRNAYDFDFNSKGEAFTYDSDNERCVNLPWYAETRFHRIKLGGFYGWLNPQRARTWRLPAYFPDTEAPLAELGRGSPTAVACYRHTQFPEKYRDGTFVADWTFGRVWFLPADNPGKPEKFIEADADFGFPPTAMAVNPKTGELLIAVGGRGTRGRVYAVRAKDGPKDAKPLAFAADASFEKSPAKYAIRTEAANDPLAAIAKGLLELDGDKPAALAGIRLVQLGLGEIGDLRRIGTVWEGYSLYQPWPIDSERTREIATKCVEAFRASKVPEVRTELARTLALIESPDPAALKVLADAITPKSDAVEDIHLLVCIARLTAPRSPEVTAKVADAVLALDRKLDAKQAIRDRNWPLRIGEMFAGLIERDPALPAAILASKEFGRPDHAFLATIKGMDQQAAARRFIERSKADADFACSADLIELLATLPTAEGRPVLLKAADSGWADSVLPILAKRPGVEDRARFLAGLASPRLNVVGDSAAALMKIPVSQAPADIAEMIKALRRLQPGKAEDGIRANLSVLLQVATNQQLNTDGNGWTRWLREKHPELAAKFDGAKVDWPAWQKRLALVDWNAGDAARGKVVFLKTTCIACHGGSQRLGPDLTGVTARFNRDDLFLTMVDPSRDISNRYQATSYEMKDGKVHTGIPVYDAEDTVLLQTGTGTIRLDGKNIDSRSPSATSLMPAGLLDKSDDKDLADLYAYLRTYGLPTSP